MSTPLGQQLMDAQKMQANIAALPAPVIAPPPDFGGGLPILPAPALPKVQSNQVLGDEDKLNSLRSSTPGVAQIHNPFLRGVARTADVLGSVFLPGLSAAIPGTTVHHNLLVNQAQQNLANDQATAEKQAQTEQTQALTRHTNDVANDLENPKPEYQPLDTSGGIVNYDKTTGKTTPVVTNGQPVMPYTKPGPMQHVVVAGPDGKPVFANYQNGKYLDAQGTEIPDAKPYEKQTEQHVPVLGDDGKPTFANYAGGKWTDTQGKPIQNPRPIPPPPSYGQLMLPTKTATFIDPKTGIPTEMQWNQATGTYDKPLGISASNAYGHEAAQAGAVARSGEQLISDIQSNRESLGTLSAWVEKHGLNTPIADPKLAGLQAELGTFAALQPAMHGFRSHSAMESFQNIIGGLQKNPDATIASIRGILKTTSAINPGLANGGAPPSGTQAFTDGGVTYHIPAGQVAEFKKDHPNAR